MKSENWFPNDTPDECMIYVKELERALEESVKLQSYYAGRLNMYDGGERLIFKDASSWKERLNEIFGEVTL